MIFAVNSSEFQVQLGSLPKSVGIDLVYLENSWRLLQTFLTTINLDIFSVSTRHTLIGTLLFKQLLICTSQSTLSKHYQQSSRPPGTDFEMSSPPGPGLSPKEAAFFATILKHNKAKLEVSLLQSPFIHIQVKRLLFPPKYMVSYIQLTTR